MIRIKSALGSSHELQILDSLLADGSVNLCILEDGRSGELAITVSRAELMKALGDEAELYKKALAFLAPKVDCATCPSRGEGESYTCGRNDLLCAQVVTAWALSEGSKSEELNG